MRLLLLRHGQTDWNAAERYQGRTDVALNAIGVDQATEAAARLAEVQLDAVYSSPLSRARRTAELAVGDRGMPIVLDDGLMETAGGDWEGLTYQEISERWPRDFAAWRAAHPEHGPVGGETPGQAGQRVVNTLRALLTDPAADTSVQAGERQVLVVAHGGCLRAAAALLLGGGAEEGPTYASLERLQNGRMIILDGSFASRGDAGVQEAAAAWQVTGYNV